LRIDKAIVYLDPPVRELLTKRGEPNFEGDHSAMYAGILTSALISIGP
jgi:hypothetical protein